MKSKKLTRIAAFLGALIIGSPVMFAQGSSTMTGNVTGTDGSPIAGVFITADGFNASTMTDNNGNFSLSVPAKATTLTFSMLGMKDVTVTIGKDSRFQVKMEESSEFLDAAVSIGYGTIIRRDLAASVSSVKSEELVERAASYNVTQALAGKVAGYNVYNVSGRPGGANQVTIRGRGSINSSYTPLYVVDGVVDVSIDMVNAADIEHIEVLKDAASTAMYGAKGANGVILVTTKNGSRDDGTVSFTTTHGVSLLNRTLKQIGAEDNLWAIRESCAYNGGTSFYYTTPYEKLFNYEKNADGSYKTDAAGLLLPHPKYESNWQKEFYQPAYITDNTVSFSKADGKNAVYTSIGYKHMNGVLPTTYAKRLNGMLNFSSKITKWMDFKGGINFSSNEQNRNDALMDGLFYFVPSIGNATFLPFQYPDGTYANKYDNDPLGTFRKGSSYMDALNVLERCNKTDQIVSNVALDFHIIKGLDLTVKGDYSIQQGHYYESCPAGVAGLYESEKGIASMSDSRTTKWANEDYLTYNRTFFNDNLKSNFVLGTSFYSDFYETSGGGMQNYSDFFGYYNIGTGTVMTASSASMTKKTMHSVYFRTNQSWKGRYLLGITLRADGASNFGVNNKYGFFPSGSLGWVMSEEPWFAPAQNTVSHLKFRVSYGTVGNSAISPYRTFATINESGTLFNKEIQTKAQLGRLGNGDLKWEEATQVDAGFDLSMWHDRVNFIVDFYNRDTHNMLYDKQVPITTGYSSTTTNLGLLRNTGFELTLNAHVIDKKNFKWDLDFIFSDNITKAIDLNGDVLHAGMGNELLTEEGHEWQRLWGFKRVGIWQLDEVDEAVKYGYHPGDAKYVDVDGNHEYNDADRMYIGRVTPRNEFSLVNTFHLGGFSLMIDVMAKTGFWIMGGSTWSNRYMVGGDNDNNRYSANFAWTPNNQATMWLANRTSGDFMGAVDSCDSYDCYRGDYLSIRNISLSYDFKRRVLKNCNFFKAMSLILNAENVAMFTVAPLDTTEAQAWGTNGSYGSNYPNCMTLSGTVKLSF